MYLEWLQHRGEAFTAAVKVATLDPFQGYKNTIGDELEDAVAVVDAFHIVKLGGRASTRSAAGCSRRPSATVVARVTRCTG